MAEAPRTQAGAYTPTLMVAANTLIRRERRLPLPGEVSVEVGDRVEAEQLVAAAALPGKVSAINVARELNVPPGEIGPRLLKHEGDPVELGEPIAEYKSFLGFFRATVLSPASGTVEAISTVTGQALIRGEPIPVELDAYVSGKVVRIEPGEAVTVECRCALIQGILGIGGEAHGELALLTGSATEPVTAEALSEAHRGKVVVCGAQLGWGVLERAREVGVAGLVAGAMSATDLDRLLGAPLGVAITGQEQVGLTLILTEGFGDLNMAQETYDLLRQYEGERVALNGATQIRAGVLRPEIVISLGGATGEASPPPSGQLQVGSRVRVVREPYFGLLGRVSELPDQLKQVETEARTRVLRARLDDGREVTVPRANVELIER
ncbi:MAG: hypothetical protein GX100_03075 [candidate division WS1 bacterium]|jgi:hypothetical protein|nr:hypothetical protein [candidate division WS1 bacterium]